MPRYIVKGYYLGDWSVEVEAENETLAFHRGAVKIVNDPAGLDVDVMEVREVKDEEREVRPTVS